ncbi:hypothetical protein E3P91_02904 [Wallemia ichthyophaga]|nr:hypothetical protein E3P91_02904 [Wallemia ichthyophaga]
MNTVKCPVCAIDLPSDAINDHLDKSCTLAKSPSKPRTSAIQNQIKNENGDWSFMTPASGSVSGSKTKKRKSASKSDAKKPASRVDDNDKDNDNDKNDSDSDLEIIPTQSKKKKAENTTHRQNKQKTDVPPAPIFTTKATQSTPNNLIQAQPLAERVRPTTIDGYVGQEDLMGENGILRSMILSDNIPSSIFWGPPGSGKTTLARIIAHRSNAKLKELSATNSGVGEAKQILDQAKTTLKLNGTRTILFIDEIHRYSKSQQDTFLPYMESGACVVIGATTENPSFKINNALLSRCHVYCLTKLSGEDITTMLRNALHKWRDQNAHHAHQAIEKIIDADFLRYLSSISDGDGRAALNSLEMVLRAVEIRHRSTTTKPTTKEDLLGSLKRSMVLKYDRDGDFHYDSISAFHKAVRGSCVDGALYWLARMVEAGEDALYIARRMVVIASEDVGMADCAALPLATATYQACQFIGLPECRINLAHCTVYLAEAAKSIRSYVGYNNAVDAVRNHPQYPVPIHLRNAPTQLMKSLGYGREYLYNPAYAHPVHQEYFPHDLPHDARLINREHKVHDQQLLDEWEKESVSVKSGDGQLHQQESSAQPAKCPKGLGK